MISFCAPLSTPAQAREMGREYAERRETTSPSPGGHLLGLGTADLSLCLPELEVVAGSLCPEKSLVSSCLARIHSRGLPSSKGSQELTTQLCSRNRAELRSARGGLTQPDLSDRGPCDPFFPTASCPSRLEDLKTDRSSVQFSRSGVSDSLRPHGLQHARLPCPSPTHGACSNSCLLSW